MPYGLDAHLSWEEEMEEYYRSDEMVKYYQGWQYPIDEAGKRYEEALLTFMVEEYGFVDDDPPF